METRLIRFRIRTGHLEQFTKEWMTGVVPLRESFGFSFIGAWSLPESNELVAVVQHEGDYADVDRAYYESAERRQLTPDPAIHIEEAFHSVVDAVI